MIVLPGFDGTPLFTVMQFFVKGILNGGITTRASAMAFNFFLALFPGIIFFFTLIPYIPIENFQDQLLDIIRGLLPRDAYWATRSTIEDIIKIQRGGLLSFGFITTLAFAANGLNSMIDGFNRTYHTMETRSFTKQWIVSLGLTVLLAIFFIAAMVLLIFSERAIVYFFEFNEFENQFTIFLIRLANWTLLAGMFLVAISTLYHFGPTKKRHFRFISAGSSLAATLNILISVGFTYFVNNFGQYNKLYGSIGTLIVILVWIYLNALVLIIGFELNASIGNARTKGKITLPS